MINCPRARNTHMFVIVSSILLLENLASSSKQFFRDEKLSFYYFKKLHVLEGHWLVLSYCWMTAY